ncbi:hypothetical protein E2L05_19665 [Meridianimarinicoccus aquatilis]|uniref:DUF2946 domain-containing protein n=2 Tax=Meridianimarinicoccus aquatilis TaxID=2552766 RepID=A0A4R6AJW8_9RHOB|nr:hypothetical protein E2L05_19665 [Fluviibacterium aquatile]
MMSRLRSSLALGLVCLIALTAVHVGAIRGQAKVAGSIVVCSSGGVVNVAVDADGRPVGPAHECPDCIMSVLAALDLTVPGAVDARQVSSAIWADHIQQELSREGLTANARGPPSVSRLA